MRRLARLSASCGARRDARTQQVFTLFVNEFSAADQTCASSRIQRADVKRVPEHAGVKSAGVYCVSKRTVLLNSDLEKESCLS